MRHPEGNEQIFDEAGSVLQMLQAPTKDQKMLQAPTKDQIRD